ncbi:MAG: 2-amino-4-hydroxy-6-hydroxymethyldihydropteridine diphosphokinase [Roseobacter sp.]
MPQVASFTSASEKSPQNRSLALIAVGSNQENNGIDPRSIVTKAIELCASKLGVVQAQSALYRTPAFPAGSGADFVNAAFSVETDLCAQVCLEHLHEVESMFGRTRQARWGARTLDLDLLALGAKILPDRAGQQAWVQMTLQDQMLRTPDRLVLPHPRLQERAFVLVPLADVAPEWLHPVTERSVAQMCQDLPRRDVKEVQRL